MLKQKYVELPSMHLVLIEHNMYWTDAKKDRVETATMDGHNRQIVLTIHGDDDEGQPTEPIPDTNVTTHFYGIAVDDKYIYMSDWAEK